MKFLSCSSRRARVSCIGLIGLVALLLTFTSSWADNTTNQMPLAESFEQYNNGDSVIGTNGWYGTTNTLLGNAFVTNMTYQYDLLPLPTATHTNVLFLDTGRTFVTNLVQASGVTNAWIDMMVRFVKSESDDDPRYTITNRVDVQMATYVNSNGYIVLYHSDNTGGGYSNVFTALDNGQAPPLGSNDWARLTIGMDYLSDQTDYLKFFKVQLDAGAPFTNAMAYLNPADTGAGKGGEWFLCSNVKGSIADGLTSLDFQGTAHLDDLQVLPTNPIPAVFWAITPSTETGGSIIPADKTLVETGNDSPAFIITNLFGYVVTNVLIDGATFIGPVGSYVFSNVVANHSIKVMTVPETRTLDVASDYGTPDPTAAQHTYDFDTVLQATLAGSPVTVGTTQYLCTGWIGTGSVPASGSTTDTGEFVLQADSSVSWLWQTNYWLQTGVNGNGSVSVNSAWFGKGTNVLITATPDQFYQFVTWSGDVVEDVIINGNQITPTMTKPRVITANFTMQNPTDLTIASPHGTGNPTVGLHTFPNGSTQTCAITDSPVTEGTTQYVCVGWIRTDVSYSELDSGSGASTGPFVLDEEMFVYWLWQTNYFLDLEVVGNGSVDETDQWVASGDNVIVTGTADPFHHFDQWTGDTDGCTIAPANVIDVDMTKPRAITAHFAITDPQELVVFSDQGAPVPDVGTNMVPSNTVQTCVVSPQVIELGTMQTQLVCTGWTGTGSVPPTGTDTNTGAFTISNNSSVVWNWQTNFWVDIVKDGNGIVNVRDGWQASHTNLSLIASFQNGLFLQWKTNDVQHGAQFVTQTVVQVGAPITITAQFFGGDPVWTNTPSADLGAIIEPSIYEELFNGKDGAVFTITNEIGYEITDVLVDGSSIGITNSYQFKTVTANHTIHVAAQGVATPLVVASPHGTPSPGVGSNPYNFNDEVTCTIAGTPEYEGTLQTQYVCTGWIGTGTVPASGSGATTGPFNIQAASTIDWLWNTNFWLATATDGNGSVDVASSWQVETNPVVVTATANAFYAFDSWAVDPTNGEVIVGNQITLPMDLPVSVTANFTLADPMNLVVISEYGTPDPALGTNVFGNGSTQSCTMAGSPVTMGTTQYVCTGWVGAGSVPASGSGTDTGDFALTQHSTVTWLWSTNYWVDMGIRDLTNPGPGSTGYVDVADGWFAAGASVQVTATPLGNPVSQFVKFQVNGSDYSYFVNPDTFTIDGAKLIEAWFIGGTIEVVPQFTDKGTPWVWLQKYGLASGTDPAVYNAADSNDYDGDFALNWEEYPAGTVPTSAASVFKVLSFVVESGSNCISWYGTTNDGVYTPFGMDRSTNLLLGLPGWVRITDNVGARAGDGTNVYWDIGAPSVQVHYRPVVTNSY